MIWTIWLESMQGEGINLIGESHIFEMPGSVRRISNDKFMGIYYEDGVLVRVIKNSTIKYAKDGVHIVSVRL